MTKRAALLALMCALLGLAASSAAAYTHYHLLSDPTYRSFCDVNQIVSCTQVYSSRFSTVRGIPVALFGAMACAAATVLSSGGLRARPAGRENGAGDRCGPGFRNARRRQGFSRDKAGMGTGTAKPCGRS